MIVFIPFLIGFDEDNKRVLFSINYLNNLWLQNPLYLAATPFFGNIFKISSPKLISYFCPELISK